jgi:hypothetical protein
MPYADPDRQRQAMRDRYAERYASDPKFRKAESKRKAKFYADNSDYQRRVKRKVKSRRLMLKK